MDSNHPRFRYIVVGYKPSFDGPIPDGSVVLFDGPAARNFEALIEAGYTVPDQWLGRLQMNLITDKVLDPNEKELP
tara:strand:+ start:3575 stop:3802 length:228 start_codon:yes stop_codon:yes gene_type:complete